MVVDQVLVLTTPVDTGRARANWIVSTGTPSDDIRDETDKSGSSSIAQGVGEIAGYRLAAGPLFIANNVPYIQRLEDGYSAQAPAGMLTSAIQAGQAVAARERVRITRL